MIRSTTHRKEVGFLGVGIKNHVTHSFLKSQIDSQSQALAQVLLFGYGPNKISKLWYLLNVVMEH